MLFYQPEGKVVNRFCIFLALLKAFVIFLQLRFVHDRAFTKKMN